MKKMLFIVLAAALFLCASCGHTENTGTTNFPNPKEGQNTEASITTPMPRSAPSPLQEELEIIPVTIARDAYLFRSAHGIVFAEMYYDVPHISLWMCELYRSDILESIEKTAIQKINLFFEQRKDEHFADTHFQELMSEYPPFFEHAMASGKTSYFNVIETEVTNYENSIYSVRQNMYWFAGGVNNFNNYGYVFDLKTGEQLSLSAFIQMDFDEFQSTLLSFVPGRDEMGYDFTADEMQYYYGRESYDQFEFYYSDGDVYIILKDVFGKLRSIIVCWSLQEGKPIAMDGNTLLFREPDWGVRRDEQDD